MPPPDQPPETEQNCTPAAHPFEWDAVRLKAAMLLAEQRLTQVQIAEECGVSRTTLYSWKSHPDFKAKVDEYLADLAAVTLREGVARKDWRVRVLQDLAVKGLKDVEKEVEPDPFLRKELRETLKQAAQEMGQLVEKHEHTSTVRLRVEDMSDDELGCIALGGGGGTAPPPQGPPGP